MASGICPIGLIHPILLLDPLQTFPCWPTKITWPGISVVLACTIIILYTNLPNEHCFPRWKCRTEDAAKRFCLSLWKNNVMFDHQESSASTLGYTSCLCCWGGSKLPLPASYLPPSMGIATPPIPRTLFNHRHRLRACLRSLPPRNSLPSLLFLDYGRLCPWPACVSHERKPCKRPRPSCTLLPSSTTDYHPGHCGSWLFHP